MDLRTILLQYREISWVGAESRQGLRENSKLIEFYHKIKNTRKNSKGTKDLIDISSKKKISNHRKSTAHVHRGI